MERERLDELTDRWRVRHDASRPVDRPPADADREALAQRGRDMAGFTYDDERYADADLEAWLLEVGRLLRERR